MSVAAGNAAIPISGSRITTPPAMGVFSYLKEVQGIEPTWVPSGHPRTRASSRGFRTKPVGTRGLRPQAEAYERCRRQRGDSHLWLQDNLRGTVDPQDSTVSFASVEFNIEDFAKAQVEGL